MRDNDYNHCPAFNFQVLNHASSHRFSFFEIYDDHSVKSNINDHMNNQEQEPINNKNDAAAASADADGDP